MKTIEVRLPQEFDKSFIVFKEKGPYFPCPWHYHPEYELVLVLKSTGKRMVGDHIGYFEPGDLVCMGPYLPHVWLNDPVYTKGEADHDAEAIVIQFQADFLGADFLQIPEMENIKSILGLASRGMAFTGKTKEKITALMTEMVHMNGIQRLSSLLSIFDILSRNKEYQLLASPGYIDSEPEGSDRLTKIKNHILTNFDQEITLSEIASMANMGVTTFCNFFKEQYRITFIEYLNTVRIGHACKLLSNEDMNIVEVAFACGFNNLANFNRQFKKLKKMTPSDFRKTVNIQEVA
ncbi:AraC family transcriptional regulator [Cyclobacterium amurskyense]|uniref:Transcriptional regulator n=1 Tax=Cyclobacterium amurskyense TaxID=320787 RepID=A0A0H4P921_9BACT|nr:AraC family transcriptional regulator [Cyclobacterium amurskyense]AKP49630.1 Transcriptional regulator [Cyclobacterium amurskyense]